MTYFSVSPLEFEAAQQAVVEMPEPRAPEEVLCMLAKNPPQSECSADAF
ncbi:hypothetical protein [Comamonas composti]|nr:hypothetical protein [Comamonas composti]